MKQSAAALAIAAALDGLWKYLALLRFVPHPIRDAIYDWVREQIENPETPFDFAQRTVPEIAYLDRLRPPAESLALAEA